MGRLKKEKCSEFHGESIGEVLRSRYNAHNTHMDDSNQSYDISVQNVKKSGEILTFPDVFNLLIPVVISKGNPTHFFERNRLVRSLGRDEMRIAPTSTIFDSIFLSNRQQCGGFLDAIFHKRASYLKI